MTSLEKSLANLKTIREGIESKIDRLAHVEAQPSAFVSVGSAATLNDVIAATTADVLARTAARLRALHEPVTARPLAPVNPFGKPATGPVIDAKFTQLKSGEKPDGADS